MTIGAATEQSPAMKFLITAGPTREPIDPVRFLSNRSSGKFGYAIASAAAEAGHEVVLISGPVAIPAPIQPHVRVITVETTRQMYEAVEARIREMDVAIMTAAVADYRPTHFEPNKIKKTQNANPVIHLEKTEDILGSARETMGFGGVLVGFAAETERLAEYATDKLERKRCDLIVANDVSRKDIGFDSDLNEISLFFAGGKSQLLPRRSKAELAVELVEIIGKIKREVP
ncbi:MAG: phosphopantothenoylcysteine synthetase/decarboxylase [Verrucomicrobiales bacterium]|jgi:phosphopantothenoylcysteine synthetase/decarboxylase